MLTGFKTTSLPNKNYSDIAMSSDGKCITVVTYLDQNASAQSALEDFNFFDSDRFKLLSNTVTGSSVRKTYIQNQVNQNSNILYSGNYFSDGSVYSSWNYGNTWQIQSGLRPRNWVSTSMSSDGRVQAIVGRGLYKDFHDATYVENTPTHIYISYDSGRTWEPKCSSRVWNGVTVSDNGSVIIASDTYIEENVEIDASSRPIFKSNILTSYNSGMSWRLGYDAPIREYYLNNNRDIYKSMCFSSEGSIAGIPYNKFGYFGRKQCSISSDGSYQLIASPVHGVLLNSGFGANDKTVVNPRFIDSQIGMLSFSEEIDNPSAEGDQFAEPLTVTYETGRLRRTLLPICCDMSSNGRYQIVAGQGFVNSSGVDEIAYRGNNQDSLARTWLSNITTESSLNPDVQISTNYGSTWSGIRSLPSGLFCFSVCCSDDLSQIRIIGRPNSTKYLSADGSYRYGASLTYAQYANYTSGIESDSNLLYFSSSNSGLSWTMQELKTVNFSGFGRYNRYLSQRVIGNMSYENVKHPAIYFNFPETEYIPEVMDIDNWNSRVLISSDGSRTLVLDQGRVLLSNSFPTVANTIPTPKTFSLNAGSYSWSSIAGNYPLMTDVSIGGSDGRYITYVVNSGSFSGIFTNDFQSLIEYSGEISGQLFDIQKYYLYTRDSKPYGFIISSQNTGLTWSSYRVPDLQGTFNVENTSFGTLTSGSTGLYPCDLSRIAISENGQYQTVFSNSVFASGSDLISQPDPSLKLYKTRFFSPIYRSSNYGVSWTTSFIECGGPRGLSVRDIDITSDGQSQLFIGNNYFTAKFNKIKSEEKFLRPDFAFVKKHQILPFGENFYENSISYNIDKVQGGGTALYLSRDYGQNWIKSGLILDITYSGTGESIMPSYSQPFYSAITSAVPTANFTKYGSLLSGYSNQIINSIGFSNYTAGQGTPRTLYLTVENIFPNDFLISGGKTYEYENRFSNGFFRSNNSGLTWEYKTIQSTQKYCNKDLKIPFYPTGSRNFTYLKASQDSSVLVALESPFYNQKISSKPLGGIINNLNSKDYSRILVSYDSGNTWSESSTLGKIEFLTISNDGNHISYLFKNTKQEDRFSQNLDYLKISEVGSRYGIPYISHDKGVSFNPILAWESDIEYNRAAFLENELVDTKCYSYGYSDLSGSSQSNLLDNAYDIIGCSAILKSGFYDRDSFTEKREIEMPIFEYINKQDYLFENFSSILFRSLKTYSNIHIDNNLYGLRYTKNGKYGIIVSNGAIQTTNNNIFSSTTTEKSTNILNIDNRSLANKIYFNDRYGDYQNPTRNYITGFGANDRIFSNFYSGRSLLPTNINYNNPVVSIGTLFDKDLSNYYLGCEGNISTISRAASNQVLFGYVNQELFTYSGVTVEDKLVNGNVFSLSSGCNLYVSNGIEPSSFSIRAGFPLPPGLSLSSFNKIIGKPTQAGFWTCVIDNFYCSNRYQGPPSIFNILISSSVTSNVTGDLRTLYVSAGTPIDVTMARVSSANFTYNFDNFISTNNLSGITGFGPIKATPPSGTIFTGIIVNPSGYFNLVSYETGRLTGQIFGSRSTFSWAGVEVTGTGVPNNIYYDFITGYTPSSNNVIINTGKLVDGDLLYLNDTAFIYKNTQLEADTEPYWFHGLDKFLLSGAPLVGITGYVTNGNTLNLFSYGVSGEEANDFTVTRETEDLFGIIIQNKYFTGGRTLREKMTNPFTGLFYEYYSRITKENSGNYFYNNISSPYVGIGSGVVWDNSFRKNYTITTGAFASDQSSGFNGSLVPFILSSNIYSGNAIIPSGQKESFTGIKFIINREKYLYSSSDISEYIITGNDFLYSGRINL